MLKYNFFTRMFACVCTLIHNRRLLTHIQDSSKPTRAMNERHSIIGHAEMAMCVSKDGGKTFFLLCIVMCGCARATSAPCLWPGTVASIVTEQTLKISFYLFTFSVYCSYDILHILELLRAYVCVCVPYEYVYE